jgi:hypothetical protein
VLLEYSRQQKFCQKVLSQEQQNMKSFSCLQSCVSVNCQNNGFVSLQQKCCKIYTNTKHKIISNIHPRKKFHYTQGSAYQNLKSTLVFFLFFFFAVTSGQSTVGCISGHGIIANCRQ